MTATARVYSCAHCPATFTNYVVLGGHVHANHPEHKRRTRNGNKDGLGPRFDQRRPAHHGVRALDTDRWPGKP